MIRKYRCAIYTRKSTEEGLEKEFNSLDAQREACEAYIKSQAGEGWTLVKTSYDDGGFSGGSIDRPALARLLEDVKAKKIDVVVVYKVDRLTRALSDFAKIVDIFDAQGVSFVSITQSFNTTTSMGRLTLNVLLSFAQFEREVIAERVRDKIAASKAKGMWMGGIPPIGYDLKDKHLIVNPAEAELVRSIFRRYLELSSVHHLTLDLRERGLAGKRWTPGNGKPGCKNEWSSGSLLHLLKRRLYLGLVPHKGKDHPGRHAPIVDQDLFDRVQAKIAERAHSAGARRRPNSSGKLIGLIYDDAGNRMSPVRQRKGPTMIRYYVSQATIKRKHDKAGSLTRVRADRLEQLVDEHIASLATTPGRPALSKIIVDRDGFSLDIARTNSESEQQVERHRVDCRLKAHTSAKRHVSVGGKSPIPPTSEVDRTLLLRIARATRWAAELESGFHGSAREIAAAERLPVAAVTRDLEYAWKSPAEIAALVGM
ncbi:MAG: recombinase family protein [Hyphomonadaceae bacterium]